MFANDFIVRFKSDQVGPPDVQLDMANLVTVDDNEKLLEPIKIQKLNMQFFKLTSLKIQGLMVLKRPFSKSLASGERRNLQCCRFFIFLKKRVSSSDKLIICLFH